MNVLDSLRSLNGYPIPVLTLELVAAGRGLDPEEEVTPALLRSASFMLAKADVLVWLSGAPDVTQEGISYSFTDEQRNSFKISADRIYGQYGGEDDSAAGTVYGYKGDRL